MQATMTSHGKWVGAAWVAEQFEADLAAAMEGNAPQGSRATLLNVVAGG